MKLHELDQAFVTRLENWGRYYAPAPRQGVSPTHEVCKLLAVAAGKEIVEGFAESKPKTEIDAGDAQIIEWCMSKAAYRLSAQDRALIKAHWVSRADPRMVCRVMRLRWLSWEKALCEAVIEFQRVVQILENCQAPENTR